MSRNILWRKLAKWGLPWRLLGAIISLYSNTWVQVKTGPTTVSAKIPTADGLKQGCVLAPLLFNLYTADLGSALEQNSLLPPKLSLGTPTLHILQYADDIVLMDQTKTGLQRALNSLHDYNIANSLKINQEKTKVLIFGRRKNKKSLIWHIGPAMIRSTRKYNYLGIWFSETSSPTAHLVTLKKRAGAITYSLSRLNQSLASPSAEPILKVIKATLLPALSYGHQAFPGACAASLDQFQSSTYKKIFKLPNYIQRARLRLEFGLLRQTIVCDADLLKYYIRTLKLAENTLKAHLKEAIVSSGSPWKTHIANAIRTLKIDESQLSEASISYSVWKKIINKQAKLISFQVDTRILKSSTILSPLNESYQLGFPQPYLLASLNPVARQNILFFRLLGLRSTAFNRWAPTLPTGACRLCGYRAESWLHLLCCCPALDAPRRRLLKPLYLKWGIRSCREASALSFKTADILVLARTGKFTLLLDKLLSPPRVTESIVYFSQKLILDYFYPIS